MYDVWIRNCPGLGPAFNSSYAGVESCNPALVYVAYIMDEYFLCCFEKSFPFNFCILMIFFNDAVDSENEGRSFASLFVI